MKSLCAFLILLFVFSIGVASAIPYQSGNFDPVRPDVDTWECYDYAINYARENPEWGIVTMSANPNFYGISHMVNYKIENGTFRTHDEMYNFNCTFEFDYRKSDNPYHFKYYKFWSTDETPLRNYRRLKDNSMEWFNDV